MSDELLVKLTKDLRDVVKKMGGREARYLCSAYLQMQDQRKRASQRIARLGEGGHAVMDWVERNTQFLENQIRSAMKSFAEAQPMGRWALEVEGIGPVIAAGLLAHIELEPWHCAHADKDCRPETPCSVGGCHYIRVRTAGQIWRFAGLDPTAKWEKGKKRPFNAALKQICFYIGESFVKKPESFFGRVYRQRKEYEAAKNEQGEYATQAETGKARVGKSTEAFKWYAQGKLPPGQLHRRAARYATKLFLSQWFMEAYRQRFNEEAPLPYPVARQGHAHVVEFPRPRAVNE